MRFSDSQVAFLQGETGRVFGGTKRALLLCSLVDDENKDGRDRAVCRGRPERYSGNDHNQVVLSQGGRQANHRASIRYGAVAKRLGQASDLSAML